MTNKFLSWPIRVHLTILIALLAVPSIGLIVYSGMAERRQAIVNAKTECLKFVNDVAAQQQALGAGAEQLAAALAVLPAIQSRNSAAATALFSELLRKNPQYANISVADKSGLVWASAVPFEGSVSVADRKSFQDAARSGTFSSGEYAIGRMAKKPVMSFGYPVKSTGDELVAVIGVVLNLDYSQGTFATLDLPPNSAFDLLDHQGIVLGMNLNNPYSEKQVGKPDATPEVFAKMREGPGEGTFEAVGSDGRFQLAAYKKISLPYESKPYLYVRSSIALASATSRANAAMFRNLSVLVSLFLIGLGLAWFVGTRIIVNPIMMLKEASRKLAAGTDAVNVSSLVKGGELGELACAFDDMAHALLQREMARNLATDALRESEQRWAATLASAGDAVLVTNAEGQITFMNQVAEELTGWTFNQALTKPVEEIFNIVDEKTRLAVESPVAKVLRDGMIVGLADHNILVKKDGTVIPVDNSGAPIRGKDGKIVGIVLVFRNITDRKQAEDRIKSLLAEKELLLREVHHRIKNNMNVIRSLLTLQSRTLEGNPSAVAALHDASSRVQSMMVLYDRLYRSSEFRGITAEAYLGPLIDEIVANFPNKGSVIVETQIDDLLLDAKTASPVGMILNELLTNAMKYAFQGRDHGEIFVSVSAQDNHVTFLVRDNGIGTPESIDIANSTGFGLHLVNMLTEQLEGTLRLERGKGSTFILEFDL